MIVKLNWIPGGFSAMTCYPFIFIKPEFTDDNGLIEHELVHYYEQRKSFVLPWLAAYLCSKKFRLEAELRAYRKQISVSALTVHQAAIYLTKYKLGIDHAEAVEALTTTQLRR